MRMKVAVRLAADNIILMCGEHRKSWLNMAEFFGGVFWYFYCIYRVGV